MTSVVVVGSGFTGFECARRLARHMRRQKAPVEVTLISPIDYLLYRHKNMGLVVDLVEHTLTFTDPEQRSRCMSWDRQSDAEFSASQGIPLPKAI